MKDFVLDVHQITALRLAHKGAVKHNAKEAYRLNAVILLGTGWSLKSVSEALLLDEETLRTYVKKYLDGDIKNLLSTKHSGNNANKLSEEQKAELEVHLKENLSNLTKKIISYVRKKYKVKYSRSGITALLHALGFTYKKPKLIPELLDVEAQEDYLEFFNEFIKEKPENEAVLFYDSTHPTYGTIPDYGWIKKGTEALLPSPASRQRLNISGAVELTTLNVITTFPTQG
jgi:transposase